MSDPAVSAGVLHLTQGYEPKLLTAANLAVLPSELLSGTVRYELHHQEQGPRHPGISGGTYGPAEI